MFSFQAKIFKNKDSYKVSEKEDLIKLDQFYNKKIFFYVCLILFFLTIKKSLKTLLLWYTVYYYSIKKKSYFFCFFLYRAHIKFTLIKHKKEFRPSFI